MLPTMGYRASSSSGFLEDQITCTAVLARRREPPHVLILCLITMIYQIAVLMLVKVAVELLMADNTEAEEQW